MGDKCCKNGGTGCGQNNGDSNGHTNGDSNGHTNGDSNGHGNGDSNGYTEGCDIIEESLFQPHGFVPYDPSQEPIFPPELKVRHYHSDVVLI